MFDLPRRSLRIQANQSQEEYLKRKKLMFANALKCKASLVDEKPENLSQKLQHFKANIDDMDFKHLRLMESLTPCLKTHLAEGEKFIKKCCESNDQHYERYDHLHSEYCRIWFRGTGKWGCLASIKETGGFLDKSSNHCGFRHQDLDN